MTTHQLAPTGNKDTFEELNVDLFNYIHSTNTFDVFGRQGQKQKGIDVFSPIKNIAIQCKKKDLLRKDIDILSELKSDIKKDINKIISEDLEIDFTILYFTSTYKDHTSIQEYCEIIKKEKKLKFEVIYWGWDTIEKNILPSQKLLEKYYSQFIIQQNSIEKSFLRNLDLKKRIQRDFSDWLDFFPKDRKLNSKMTLRSFEGTQYPYSNEREGEFNEFSWFAAEIKRLYHNGLEFIFGFETITIFENGTWALNTNRKGEKDQKIDVQAIGQINFSDIVEYDIRGDEYYLRPQIFCRFRHKGFPFEKVYYYGLDVDGMPQYFGLD